MSQRFASLLDGDQCTCFGRGSRVICDRNREKRQVFRLADKEGKLLTRVIGPNFLAEHNHFRALTGLKQDQTKGLDLPKIAELLEILGAEHIQSARAKVCGSDLTTTMLQIEKQNFAVQTHIRNITHSDSFQTQGLTVSINVNS